MRDPYIKMTLIVFTPLLITYIGSFPNLQRESLPYARDLNLLSLFQVRRFQLFPDYGEVTVSLDTPKPLDAAVHLDTCQRFHCLLFSHVLRVPLEVDPVSSDGCLIVLVTATCSVDTIRMKELVELAKTSRDNDEVNDDEVVMKCYDDSRRLKERFAVTKVRCDLSPRSPFPDLSRANTFEDYFLQKYGLRIKNKAQPLLEVKNLSGRVNFLVNRNRTQSKSSSIFLAPELCDAARFPASLLSLSAMLPSVLHRVNSLFLVADLRRTVAEGHGRFCDGKLESDLPPIGVDEVSDAESGEVISIEIENENDKGEEFPELCSKLKELFLNGPRDRLLPDSALILQALTTTSAGDGFDLERLEMLGDAFLKLAVSFYLFCSYKDKDEGKLTQRKVKQVSNLALFRAAEKKSLGGYLQSTKLSRDMWCPTGCRVTKKSTSRGSEPMEVDIQNPGRLIDASVESEETSVESDSRAPQNHTIQKISDKSVADSVEGLIGAYLISCGYTGALNFMKFLGLKVLPENDDGVASSVAQAQPGRYAMFNFSQTNLSAFDGIEELVSNMTSGLESFERCINYNFQSKLYLLEALTHASYHANRVTVCYQRLEFLGDALLDFLLTQHLYFLHGNLSPGQLTDVRQALVNNNIFATIAVKYQYHKYLKQMSPQWFKKIANFLERVEDESTGGNVGCLLFLFLAFKIYLGIL